MQRLILRRGTDILTYREVRDKSRDFNLAQVRRVPAAMKENKPAYPGDIRFLGSPTVATGPQAMPNPLQQPKRPSGLVLTIKMRFRNRRKHGSVKPAAPPPLHLCHIGARAIAKMHLRRLALDFSHAECIHH